MLVRAEQSVDKDAIYAVTKAAFDTDAEARLIDMLRGDGDLLFSHVADEKGKIMGHIALSPMQAVADDRPVRALGLGPVAVAPERQRSGIGSQLMNASVRWARHNDWQLIILLGDPRYYCRFGFSADAAKPFASPYAGPYFQALWLDESLQTPQSGRADYAPAFGRL